MVLKNSLQAGQNQVSSDKTHHGFLNQTSLYALIRTIDVGNGNYKEIQIKSRTSRPLFQVKKTSPRDSLFIICYPMSKPEVWIIPSKVFFEKGSRAKGRTGKDYVRVAIGNEGSSTYEAFREYRDNFHLLTRGATSQVRRAVERYHPHLLRSILNRLTMRLRYCGSFQLREHHSLRNKSSNP